LKQETLSNSLCKDLPCGEQEQKDLEEVGCETRSAIVPNAVRSTTSFGMVIVYANVSIIEESDQNLEYPSIDAC
jgi:hypothetical protein